jgi:DNA-directed RNA polymerase subunit delta
MQSELSLIQAAEAVLRKHKKPVDIYQLFDESLDLSFFDDDNKDDLVTKFYADLITSALFIYVGDNMWDLKENQKIELWDKDGSHYKEYTVVELPKEEKPKPKAKPAKVEKVKVVEEEVAEEVVEEVKEKIIEPKDKVLPQVEVVAENNQDDAVDDYEEEVFDEYDDDFDEEKYNEYMDTYEDQYDD